MQHRKSLSYAVLVLVGVVIFAACSWAPTQALAALAEAEAQAEKRLIEGAKKEGKLAFWINGWNAAELEQLFGKFRQRYPFVTVEYWRASEDTQLHQKMMSEARAGIQNVDIASSEINLIDELKKAGVVKKYHWPNTAGWAAQHKDPDGYWVASNVNGIVVVYNTNLIPAADAPKKWEDLLNPKWKGAISMDRDAAEWVLMLWAAWGKEKAVNYLKALAKNNVVFGAGQTARLEMLGAGAFKIDLRLNLFRVLQYQKKGAPVQWVRTDPVLAKATPMLIAERAPHPNTALLFADWFTSLEGQQAFTDITGRLVPDSRVKGPTADAVRGQKVFVPPPEMAQHGSEAEAIWRELFLK
jgi:iron(III) transport system substrate-binding protein